MPRFLGVLAMVAFGAAVGCDRLEGRPESRLDAGGTDPEELQMAANQLTADEADEGFELLFDGKSLDAWRGFRMESVPAGWGGDSEALTFTPGVESGDLITVQTYANFDLRLEWKVGPSGNSGVFFGIVETTEKSYESGPEMQVLDDAGHRDGQNPLTSSGSNYGLYAPSAYVTRPLGEWNEARIVRAGNRVRQWLNGTQVVEYELGSPEWTELVANSKFVEWPDYGVHHEGHIGLQDHGNPVWYRNLRIRRLEPTP